MYKLCNKQLLIKTIIALPIVVLFLVNIIISSIYLPQSCMADIDSIGYDTDSIGYDTDSIGNDTYSIGYDADSIGYDVESIGEMDSNDIIAWINHINSIYSTDDIEYNNDSTELLNASVWLLISSILWTISLLTLISIAPFSITTLYDTIRYCGRREDKDSHTIPFLSILSLITITMFAVAITNLVYALPLYFDFNGCDDIEPFRIVYMINILIFNPIVLICGGAFFLIIRYGNIMFKRKELLCYRKRIKDIEI